MSTKGTAAKERRTQRKEEEKKNGKNLWQPPKSGFFPFSSDPVFFIAMRSPSPQKKKKKVRGKPGQVRTGQAAIGEKQARGAVASKRRSEQTNGIAEDERKEEEEKPDDNDRYAADDIDMFLCFLVLVRGRVGYVVLQQSIHCRRGCVLNGQSGA